MREPDAGYAEHNSCKGPQLRLSLFALLLAITALPTVAAEQTPQMWPEGSSFPRLPGHINAVVFLSETCPCTPAAVTEFAALAVSSDSPVALTLVVAETNKKRDLPTPIDVSCLVKPDATVVADPDGLIAQRFGATVSGDCFVFDGSGRLILRGGIAEKGTRSKKTLRSFADILAGKEILVSDIASYGCPLDAGTNISHFDFFTNFGNYTPRINCLSTAEGSPDWPWIVLLMVLNVVVLAGYVRIFRFWRQCYLSETEADRDDKLMSLARMFLICGGGSYGLATVIFVWPRIPAAGNGLDGPGIRYVAFCFRLGAISEVFFVASSPETA